MAASAFVRACMALGGALLACALAAAPPPADLDARLAAIEHRGRADPQAALEALDALLPALHAAADRLPALRLQGALAAALPDAERAERSANELEALAARVEPASAQAAAAYVRARLLRNGGPLGRADRLLGAALARLPETAPIDDRVRYLSLHADVKDGSGQLDDAVRLFQQALALADARGPAWRRAELRSSLAYTLYQAGQTGRAHALNREAHEIAAAAGDDVALASAATVEAILATHDGDAVRELRAMHAAIEHARRAGAQRDEVLGLANLSDYYLKRGEFTTALARAQEALSLARALKSASIESLALANSGLALVSLRSTSARARSTRWR
jgi:tetratricopeptide (TPR) repeat protein